MTTTAEEHTHLVQRLEAERHRPVPPPRPDACAHGPTAYLLSQQHATDARETNRVRTAHNSRNVR